ncbi:hypothetical protein Celal_3674 [Cellulophaga algicola DSM 14237]|uniref:Lipoprotein n=1 Tax=Cellulophaga algicola (strain DSM 14237 / IC166 / ACAM 630) TaxID=688270 RepID=E6X9W8_CELAD|nr:MULTISPECIES: hypothetical protein [Cellulophaga]ADV50929.1 hypothetical protein Celal_3674 [Cellulophaga algicola DSM 14237]
MKKILLATSILFFISCGGVKKTQEALNSGNYSSAINKALDNLVDNKTKKGNQPYILLLEEAFKKNTARELKQIAFLQKSNNAANYEQIYTSYVQLKQIEERIQPLLPLTIYEEGREAKFSFKDYDAKIIATKDQLSAYLYTNASKLLDQSLEKNDFRKAYDDLLYLEKLNPGYKNTSAKIKEAHLKGIDYVQVRLFNDTQQIIPSRLEEDLLNFNTFGLNNLWTEYHTNAIDNIPYDYEMDVVFKNISISPEQIKEKQISKEKQIKDGYTYALDRSGNQVKDSLGNRIKIDKFKTVKCDFYQFTQFKSAEVAGQVNFLDLKTKQQINTYPLASTFVFEHSYAKYSGDKLALDNELISLLSLAAVSFPSNEQMVYDAGEDLKANLKGIITRHQFN